MKSDWIAYCDICGQRYRASQLVELPTHTGRGGLMVCKYDADKIDYGVVPYTTPKEKHVPYVRINHTDVTNGSAFVDLEAMAYIYYLAASQDGAILMANQDDAWLEVREAI